MKKFFIVCIVCSCSFFASAKEGPSLFAATTGDSLQTMRLFEAIRSGSVPALENELNQGAGVNDTLSGYSPLMVAAMSGTIEQMRLLIDRGANVNFINGDSLTPLFMAVPDWHKTNLLIEHGANFRQQARDGATLLSKLASIPGSAQLMQMLIGKGLDAQKCNGHNILIFNAALSGDTSNLAFFIRFGFNVRDTNQNGVCPLVLAAGFYCLPTIKMLVEHGANVNDCSRRSHYTALMRAARSGDDETMVYLLEQGADANVVNNVGYTALTYLGLSETDRPDIAETFCKELGPSAFKKARDGANGVYYAEKKGPTRSMEILKRYMQQQQK